MVSEVVMALNCRKSQDANSVFVVFNRQMYVFFMNNALQERPDQPRTSSTDGTSNVYIHGYVLVATALLCINDEVFARSMNCERFTSAEFAVRVAES